MDSRALLIQALEALEGAYEWDCPCHDYYDKAEPGTVVYGRLQNAIAAIKEILGTA